MAKFRYKAKNMAGKVVEGIYEAPDRQNVVDMIRQKSFYLLEIEELAESKDLKEMDIFAKITAKDLTIYCKQFASILKAGVPLIQALQMLGEQTENQLLASLTRTMSSDIQKGSSLSEAMAVHEKHFPQILIHMIHAGEVSGTLETSLETMAVHFEKAYKLKSKVKGAMTYPIVVLVVSIAVVIFLLVAVVPTFVGMFDDSGTELPGVTQALIGISDFLSNNFVVLIAFIVIAFGLFRLYLSGEAGRMSFDRFKLSMPLLGDVQRKSVSATFARTMSTLMATGVGITEAIKITSKVVNNVYVEEELDKIERQVREGKGLHAPSKDSGLFPPMLENMIMLGEETGNLEDMLSKTAEFFEEEVDEATERLTTLIEPMIIVGLAVVVAFIVIAIALPMFDMSSIAAG